MRPEHLLLLFSLTFVAVGIAYFRKQNRLRTVGKKAKAVIVNNKLRADDEEGQRHYPVISFQTDKQQSISHELSTGYEEPREVGTKLSIIYNPENPLQFEIDSILHLFGLPLLFIVIGIAGMILSSLEIVGIVDMMPTELEYE